ncbi:MAG TPA: toxin-antitoxin system HicB family antitoxin, partial [Nakamurella sp.]
MDLTPYTQNLRDDLLTAASVGDEDSRRAAALLASAIEPAARLAIMNALSDLAAEVTGALQDTSVELRLDGRDVRVSVTRHVQEAVAAATDAAGWTGSARDAGPADGGPSADDLRR